MDSKNFTNGWYVDSVEFAHKKYDSTLYRLVDGKWTNLSGEKLSKNPKIL